MYNEIEGTNSFQQTNEYHPPMRGSNMGMDTREAKMEEDERKRDRNTWIAALAVGAASLALIVTAVVVGVNSTGKTTNAKNMDKREQGVHQRMDKKMYKHHKYMDDYAKERNYDNVRHGINNHGYGDFMPHSFHSRLARRYADQQLNNFNMKNQAIDQVQGHSQVDKGLDVRHIGPNWYYNKLLGVFDKD